jgi:hypothetical protein
MKRTVKRGTSFLQLLLMSLFSFQPPVLHYHLYLKTTLIIRSSEWPWYPSSTGISHFGGNGQKIAFTLYFILQRPRNLLASSAANFKILIVRSFRSFHFAFLPTSPHTVVILHNGATNTRLQYTNKLQSSEGLSSRLINSLVQSSELFMTA